MEENSKNEKTFFEFLIKYIGVLFATNIASYLLFDDDMKHTWESRRLLYGYVYDYTEYYYDYDSLIYIIIPMFVVSAIIFATNLFKYNKTKKNSIDSRNKHLDT